MALPALQTCGQYLRQLRDMARAQRPAMTSLAISWGLSSLLARSRMHTSLPPGLSHAMRGRQWFEFTKACPSHLLRSRQPLHVGLYIAGICWDTRISPKLEDEELKTSQQLGPLSTTVQLPQIDTRVYRLAIYLFVYLGFCLFVHLGSLYIALGICELTM